MNRYDKQPDSCMTTKGDEMVEFGFVEVKEEAHKNSATKINKTPYKVQFARTTFKVCYIRSTFGLLKKWTRILFSARINFHHVCFSGQTRPSGFDGV